jgi:DNA-binding NarL/FixJ family response regulator
MLCDILRRAVAAQADMSIVGEITGLDQLLGIGRDAAPDVVIVGLEGKELPPSCWRLLEARPRVKIVVVAAGGREAILHQLGSDPMPVSDVSTEGILRAIRTIVARPVVEEESP